jgi:hypothetical protein
MLAAWAPPSQSGGGRLALGIVVSETTSVPLAPELGAVVGGLLGWLSRRERE